MRQLLTFAPQPVLAVANAPDRDMPWAAGGSLGFHLAIVVALALLPAAPRLLLPQEEPVSVEIIAPPPPIVERPEPPAAPPIARPGPVLAKPDQPAAPDDGMVRAQHFFSEKLLADPRSRHARDDFKQLASAEQVVQLCNIEAMEQVHRWDSTFQPDYLMAYAMAGAKVSAQSVEVDGGAFRSKKHWYNIKFKCAVAPGLRTVVAFEFQVGAEIPKSQWAEHFLTLESGSTD
jgi:hypothetical protein